LGDIGYEVVGDCTSGPEGGSTEQDWCDAWSKVTVGFKRGLGCVCSAVVLSERACRGSVRSREAVVR